MYSCAVLIMLESNTRPDFKEKQLRVWQFCGKPLESELAFFPGRAGENKIGSFQVYKICIRFHLRDNFGLIFQISQASHLFLKKKIKSNYGAELRPIQFFRLDFLLSHPILHQTWTSQNLASSSPV